ncbi:YbaB/EbfC family nucleoid-associated protein [Nocardia aurantia]|uniref:YbaB/EbfC family DNA-binding protein n=1 Tax=Nocardia aurantia TaxID=2585199 RepID=A0A7K0DH37_9NOCA|nr:YbaB/EbfC family nucleoid-associated protein [Nocardia aurantia]MQY24998.1 hypothetical protein [Nocardia aurantia]
MANEAEKAQLAGLKDLVQGAFVSITHAQEQRAQLTAAAHAAGRRVTITVNADGVVIKTEFSDSIDDLTYSEIAAAVTAATQDAAAQVRQQAQRLMADLQREQARMPSMSEFFPMMPDIRSMIPTPPEVPTSPPGSPDRVADASGNAVRFTEVEEYEHDPAKREQSGIAAPVWE